MRAPHLGWVSPNYSQTLKMSQSHKKTVGQVTQSIIAQFPENNGKKQGMTSVQSYPVETHKSRLVIGWFLFYNISWLVNFEFVTDIKEDGTTLYGRIYLCTYNRSKAFSSRNASRSIVCIWFSDSCLQEKWIADLFFFFLSFFFYNFVV